MKLETQLDLMKHRMLKELLTGDKYLDSSLNYVALVTGKMLRPTFMLIGASIATSVDEKKYDNFISIGAAIESFHLATLLHDDIIDEAKMRRGQPSVQTKYSKEYALYMGDFIMSRSFMMLAQLEIPKEIALNLAKVLNQICIGEMKQYKYRYQTQVTPFQYLHVISKKTAALFSVSLSVGAAYGDAPEKMVTTLAKIGYEIGMAFQLIDDILDYVGDAKEVGKDLLSDLEQGYYNIPVLFALNSTDSHSQQLKILLEQKQDLGSIEELIRLVIALKGIEKTKELAQRYTSRAMKLIHTLPESPGKNSLLDMTPKLLLRMK